MRACDQKAWIEVTALLSTNIKVLTSKYQQSYRHPPLGSWWAERQSAHVIKALGSLLRR